MIPSFKHGIIASSRPRVVAAGGGVFTVGEFNFNDQYGLAMNQGYTTNIVTMPHSGTLAVYCNNTTDGGGRIYKNGVQQTAYTTSDLSISGFYAYTAKYALFAVETGDQVYFDYYGFVGDPVTLTVEVRNASFTGTLIDTHVVEFTGECFLTTAVVNYMGLLDDGPELTAMRSLREYYKDMSGYQEIIQEYYQKSPAIISAINSLTDSSIEYNYIYNTVLAVMNHVNAEQWQQAHDLYLAMYNDLKKRYLG